ncbi:MAG: hypothetical protein R3F15_16330 [Lysobacterales bacterium]
MPLEAIDSILAQVDSGQLAPLRYRSVVDRQTLIGANPSASAGRHAVVPPAIKTLRGLRFRLSASIKRAGLIR